MDARRLRGAAFPALVVALVLIVYPSPGSVVGASGVAPMPGELMLTEAQRQLALARMPIREREARSREWSDPEVLPVAYAQALARVESGPDGSPYLVPVELCGQDRRAPNFRLASSGADCTSSDSNQRYDLYISIGIVRRSCSGCYEWAINAWADWQGDSGLDWPNSSEESFGVAWAGNLYLYSDTYTGYYMPDTTGTRRPLDIYRSDVAPNAGVGWSFHEWRKVCGNLCFVPVDWANGTAYIRQSRWQYRTDNAVMKYFHTYSSLTYSLTFSPSPGISISPTSDQWSLAAYVCFSH